MEGSGRRCPGPRLILRSGRESFHIVEHRADSDQRGEGHRGRGSKDVVREGSQEGAP